MGFMGLFVKKYTTLNIPILSGKRKSLIGTGHYNWNPKEKAALSVLIRRLFAPTG
jgi:hypothetical protein